MVTADIIARWFLTYNKKDRHDNLDVEGISNLKLQKLLYYAYGCYLAVHDEKLFHDPLLAWQHGPVVESIYHEYKNNGSRSIERFISLDYELQEELEVILLWVYTTFGQYTAWALRNMTHQETPWKDTMLNCVIPDALISAYFKENYLEG